MEKHLLLPKENRYHTNVFSYLTGRGIDNDIGSSNIYGYGVPAY
ncbi:MAG: hypothetical protein ACLUP8_16205 [Ruminococcus sp.]